MTQILRTKTTPSSVSKVTPNQLRGAKIPERANSPPIRAKACSASSGSSNFSRQAATTAESRKGDAAGLRMPTLQMRRTCVPVF